MSLFGQTKRHTPTSSYSKGRRSPLPVFAGADEKRFYPATSASSDAWYSTVLIPLPSLAGRAGDDSFMNGSAGPSRYLDKSRRRYVRICLPIPARLTSRLSRMGTRLRLVLLLALGAVVLTLVLVLGRRKSGGGGWSGHDFWDSDSLVLTPSEVGIIWEWEVASGHHPSLRQPPAHVSLTSVLQNPAVPLSLLPAADDTSPLAAYKHRSSAHPDRLVGAGPDRHGVSPWDSAESQAGYPARPTPGTILDLDLILEKCDFGTNQHVRDCLEFLRIGAGLDNGRRVRRGSYLAQFKQLYYEADFTPATTPWRPSYPIERASGLSRTPLLLEPPGPVPGVFSPDSPCDPRYPRIFHMFWAGPFSDKPYMAVMSFLFTQNLGLDALMSGASSSDTVRKTCRPQFWVWINPGPAAAVPNPSAKMEMYESLATNPWSAPFLHERFRDVVKFRMWNTTEMLDGIPELQAHWRDMPIFNSGGNTYAQPAPDQPAPTDEPNLGDVLEAEAEAAEQAQAQAQAQAEAQTPKPLKDKDSVFEKVGSKSESDYDRLSVILSDMARFVLTHRYGGIYLDADTIFLRDWEELWNYRGQFAYRWSWHDKYNTAVLKLHKGSALGTFLFKTALENGLDFHPMTVSKYLMDAGLDPLLFRIPDALFDPAWINMEKYQRDRPPFPYFPEFSAFFSNDKFDTAGPAQLGFDGFFRGAFSYHFHNFWWLPFDKSRNFPDLGERFIKGERALREAQRASRAAAVAAAVANGDGDGDADAALKQDAEAGMEPVLATTAEGLEMREDMDDEVDLSWSAVVKRTMEGYLRGERPNMYGEWISWEKGAG